MLKLLGPDRCARIIRRGPTITIIPLKVVAPPEHWRARTAEKQGEAA